MLHTKIEQLENDYEKNIIELETLNDRLEVRLADLKSEITQPQDDTTTFAIIATETLVTQNVIESQIDGTFEGWDGDTIYKLMNGQIWQQDSFDFHIHFSFMPQVTIVQSGSRYKMHVEGVSKSIYVKRIK